MYKTIDLCAGIGGIRKGFEMTGGFENVLSAETDKYACQTYEYLYGENPNNDLTSDVFKEKVRNTDYDILLAGFPCQTFSRAGRKAGFDDETKGIIFYHLEDIIEMTRPRAVFLENVDNLVSHDHGNTFTYIMDALENRLDYKVIGVQKDTENRLVYSGKDFIRNSKDFGIPQSRKRAYIMAFDRKRYGEEKLKKIQNELPFKSEKTIYESLKALIEFGADISYYVPSGYLAALEKHKERQRAKGNGFGYCILNEPGNERECSNTILATGGSGKERNLIYDPQDGFAGQTVPGKRTPINEKGIRFMTEREWGKLQGFVNYAFLDENGEDRFSFPEGTPRTQKYKMFGNSVTIPVIETMAEFMLETLQDLETQ